MSLVELPVAHRSTVDQISEVIAYANSIIAGDAVSSPERDLMTRLASMLNAKERNYAKGGSAMMWSNDYTRQEYGIAGTVLQTWKRPVRAATTIATVDPAIGATQVTVAANPLTTSATGVPFKNGDTVSVGTGANAEIVRIGTPTSTTIPFVFYEGVQNYGGLVRDHAIGEPVYVVPSHYAAGNTVFLLSEPGTGGIYNPVVWTNAQRWWQEACRGVMARIRAAEIYEPNHTALAFAGSWGALTYSSTVSGAFAGEGFRNVGALNDSVTFHLPNNFPGGAVTFHFMQNPGNAGGGVWTFTVDGGAAGTLTQVATPTVPVNKQVYYCKRITGLAAGRHTIVCQMTTLEANSVFDFATIESPDPPIIELFKGHRFLSYDASGASDHGHIRPTLQAQANPAATSVTVNQSPYAGSRQIINSPQVPKAGETIVINPRTSLEEVRTVTTVNAGGPPWVINFSGGGLANTHPVSTLVELGYKDWDQRNVYNTWVEQMKTEFDDNVLLHDPESWAHPQAPGTYPASGGPKSATMFAEDETHFSELGQSVQAEKVYQQLASERRVNPRSAARLTRPLGIPPQRIDFFRLASTTALAWTNMPAALTELFGSTLFRTYADLSRVYEARMIVYHAAVLGATNAKLRVQYSIDAGTSWRHLHRVSNSTDVQPTGTSWDEPVDGTQFMWGEISVAQALPANNAPKVSRFAPIYPEVFQYPDQVLLRVIGIGGDGVLDPTFGSVSLELR